MCEHHGSFSVTNNFIVTYYQLFGFKPIILFKFKYRAIKYRPDTNSLLSQLSKEEVIGKSVSNSKMEEAEFYDPVLDTKTYT